MDPYREEDVSYLEDYFVGSYFASRGYVVAMVDVRGTGRSEGTVPFHEYTNQELSNGFEIISQLSKKDWSNGKIGMFGLSWSGFNALMTADRKPPALQAILVAHASDDLFYQDVHSEDGVFHMDVWETMMDTLNAIPAPEEYAITPRYFTERFDQTSWNFIWKKNHFDGPVWRNESLRFRTSGLELPVYLIGGLLDGYRDTIPRIIDSSKAPVKADIGPWNHEWPNTGVPGPNYEWREKAVRWWDYWLKDRDTGILDEPDFMVFMRDGYPPSSTLTEIPGEWRCGDWPVGGTEKQRFYPASEGRLMSHLPEETGRDTLVYSPGAGTTAGTWWGDLTEYMSGDDQYSLTYDSDPLSEPVEMIGMPQVNLSVSADAPLYQWAVRLEDVWPDGKVSLVSGVLINPADRVSRLDRQPLVPGKQTAISGEIQYTTWRFNGGHKIRLSISNAQFPMAWPTPYPGKTTLITGPGTWIDILVVKEDTFTGSCDLPPFAEEGDHPEAASQGDGDIDYPVSYNSDTGETTYTSGSDHQWTVKGNSFHSTEQDTWRVKDSDPAHASFEAEVTDEISLPDRNIRVLGRYNLTSDEDYFHLTVTRQLYENRDLIREKNWNESFKREYQ